MMPVCAWGAFRVGGRGRAWPTPAVAVLLLAFAVSTNACDSSSQRVQQQSTTSAADAATEPPAAIALHFAVGSMITPKAGFAYYRKLLDYLEKKLGREVKFADRETYAEVNDMLERGSVDAAFVCGGPYVEGAEDFGLELLAVPQTGGKTTYHSVMIVPQDSPVTKLEELRGKSFAFVDPKSNTGSLVPTYVLAKMNESPEGFFGKLSFTYAHDKSVRAVARGEMDGAAVDSLIFEYMKNSEPDTTAKVKEIWRSPPYGIPPVVVRKELPTETKQALQRIFLELHQDPEAKKILEGMGVDKFVLGDDASYASIREMRKWLANNTSAEPQKPRPTASH